MQTNRSSSVRWVRAALLVVSPLAIAEAATAQCPWFAGPMCVTQSSVSERQCSRTVTVVSASCVETAANATCFEVSYMGRGLIGVEAPTPTVGNEYCQWQCNGQTCRIEAIDGLPVELLEFGVDPEEGAERTGAAVEDEPTEEDEPTPPTPRA